MQIPDYQIVCKCGHGAYGEVWIALNRIDSWVAIKTVVKSEQIEKELAGLRSYSRISGSPHLIRIFHVGEIGNLLYYTMELADNLGSETHYIPATLANVLQERKRFTPAETVGLGSKLLAGLETLHQAGLVHRDIKPENILFVSGEPKLSDIGLMRSVSQSLSLGGTLGFIPPERLKSGSGGKNGSDDLYALGKVLYCCLTGNSVEDYPSFPVSLLDEACCHLNEVILTACNKNTALRFKNAGEFRNSLANGISRRKRLFGTAFQIRYWVIGLLIPVIISGIWLFLKSRIVLQSPPEKPLVLGEIQNRTDFALTVEVGDPDLNSSHTGYEDPIFRKYSPSELDSAPRSQEIIFNRLRSDEWSSFNARGFSQSASALKITSDAEGGIRLMLPLDYAYAIRFEINYEKLEDLLTFQIAALNAHGGDRSFYQWTLLKTQGKLTLKPLEYQAENGERKLLFPPTIQPKDTPGFHRVEMLQTSKIFRLYIDEKLVLYAPSFFLGGYFTIIAQGGDSNFVELRKFELLKILHAPKCPPEEQYRLPNEK